MKIGDRIGTGAQADVFIFENCAVKIFKHDRSKSAVFYEAAITSLIELTGLPIAKVQEVIKIENQLAIKMDYINGISLNQCMISDISNIEYYLNIMAGLQININSKTIPLPFELKNVLKSKIENNAFINDRGKTRLLRRLDILPKGIQLCHGDYQGDNIIKQDEEFFVIDWVDATNGHPDGDVCRTYMLYSFIRPDVADLYLDCYCRKTNKKKESILEWLPVVAAARLDDNNSSEKEKIMSWIKDV